ncbi:hypothetical protein C8Q76DRAFT_698799 [Earliella scabrosa]|nr:hypothetical protein C8Q76DRAFT_698799 [Earliella scabrosa]
MAHKDSHLLLPFFTQIPHLQLSAVCYEIFHTCSVELVVGNWNGHWDLTSKHHTVTSPSPCKSLPTVQGHLTVVEVIASIHKETHIEAATTLFESQLLSSSGMNPQKKAPYLYHKPPDLWCSIVTFGGSEVTHLISLVTRACQNGLHLLKTALGQFVTFLYAHLSESALGQFVTFLYAHLSESALGQFVTFLSAHLSESALGQFVTFLYAHLSESALGQFVTFLYAHLSESALGQFVTFLYAHLSESALGQFVTFNPYWGDLDGFPGIVGVLT